MFQYAEDVERGKTAPSVHWDTRDLDLAASGRKERHKDNNALPPANPRREMTKQSQFLTTR